MTDYKMINQDDYDKIRLHFEMMDKNKDGKITRQEILEVLSKGNKKVDMKAVNDLIDKSDVNKDGYISWNEFLAMMTKKKEKEALKKEQEAEKLSSRHIDEEESLMAFKMFDSDNNGLISFDELQQAMKVMRHLPSNQMMIKTSFFQELGLEHRAERLRGVFQSLDTNNDGQVDAIEFRRLLG